jgi:hypothetical protein
MLGRLFLLLRAAHRLPVITSDDALLPDEFEGRRKGNPKLVGIAVALAHRKGWIAPLYSVAGVRQSRKSGRHARARGIIELWTRTDLTEAALVAIEQALGQHRPRPRNLFENDGE